MEKKSNLEMSDYEQFIHNRGCEFPNKKKLEDAYDRKWKSSRGILITKEEFVAEVGELYKDVVGQFYSVIIELFNKRKLNALDVYLYAKLKWCIRNPEAIIAYETDTDTWTVNRCDTEVSEAVALMLINREWGFEISRIELIGKPYYDATDYQFIRFNCGHMTWLWVNGNLLQVYE